MHHFAYLHTIKNLTIAGLFSLLPFTSCNNSNINKKITLDRDRLHVECKVNYEFSGWGSGDPTESKNTVSFCKEWDLYIWKVSERIRWPFENLNSFESKNLEEVRENVIKRLTENNSKLTEKLKELTVKKVNFAAEVLDSTEQNKPLPKNEDGFTIEVK